MVVHRMRTTRSLCCIFYVCLAVYMVNSGGAMASNSLHIRQLQTMNQTLNYRATYKADFQHLRDFQCMLTEPPILELTCYGSVMTILKVSDPSISCSRLENPKVTNGTTYQCTTSCTDCSTVYENSGDAGDDPYGSIEFMCEGDDYRQVDADYVFTSGTDGECISRSEPQTRNYHVARFGVSCPTSFGRDYVYDDTYFECTPRGSTSPGFAIELSPIGDADVYFCLSGDNCLGESCTVPYDELRIRATLPSFFQECVESLVPLTSPPTNAPAIASSTTKYTVQYQASWGRLYDTDASRQSCQGSNPTVLITCGHVATISYVSSTDSSMVCESLTGSDFSCTGNAALIENNFTSVVYNCTGPKIPLSRVNFPGSSNFCVGNTQTSIVTHAVNLGIWCQFAPNPAEFYYTDWAAECVESGHDFENIVGEYGFDFARYTCRESVTFVVGSTAAQTIRNVSISTDETFPEDPEGCYLLNVAPTVPTVTLTFPPTSPPSTRMPSVVPSIDPSPIPSASPTIIVTPAPSTSDTLQPQSTKPVTSDAPIRTTSDDPSGEPPVSVQTSSSSDNSIIGIAIGCVGGGFALAALIAMILFIKNRDPTGGNKKTGNGSAQTHGDFNTVNDFSSSQSRSATSGTINSSLNSDHLRPAQPIQPQPILNPIDERTSNNVVDGSTKPEVSMYVVSPDTPYRNYTAPQATRSSTHRSSNPNNHVLNVKDQCRSVAMVRSSSPTFISRVDHSNIPIATAMGVPSIATTTVVEATPANLIRSKPEPSGRRMVDDSYTKNSEKPLSITVIDFDPRPTYKENLE